MLDKEKTCKTCKHCKVLFIYTRHRYVRSDRDFCAQRKLFIDDNSGCEMWQQKKSWSELIALGDELKLEDVNIKVIYLDD